MLQKTYLEFVSNSWLVVVRVRTNGRARIRSGYRDHWFYTIVNNHLDGCLNTVVYQKYVCVTCLVVQQHVCNQGYVKNLSVTLSFTFLQ